MLDGCKVLLAVSVGFWCEIMMMIFKFGEVDYYGIPSGRYSNKCDLSGWFEGPPFLGGLALEVYGDPSG